MIKFKIYMMKILIILLLLYTLTNNLKLRHQIDTPIQKQIDNLRQQQDKFKLKIQSLINNLTQIERNVNDTTKTTQKVLILQKAITSQRKQIFQLSKILIPNFNLSQCTCDQLTDKQKINLLDAIQSAKKQIQKLQQLSKNIPPCDQLDQINSDLAKQAYFLESMETILYTQCKTKVILSPTVFQSNIYAKNWILGSQTIDDLIQEYYQRSIKYQSVTNCPLQKPFFDGKKCVICDQEYPVFNMFTRKCQHCDQDFDVDNDLKKCVPVKFSTNFQAGKVLLRNGQEIPKQEPNTTLCPKKKPYYGIKDNGTIPKCIACSPPNNLFNLSSKSCTSCNQTNNQAFDKKTHTCRTLYYVNNQKATNLLQSGTDTVQKAKLRENEIRQKQFYQQCNQTAPYSTQKGCVACNAPNNVFNLSSKSCTSCQEGQQLAYDSKTSSCRTIFYINNENAKNLLQSDGFTIQKLKQRQNEIKEKEIYKVCDQNAPYSTQKQCVACTPPNNIFSLKTKSCTSCNGTKQDYDNKTNSCKPIYFITNMEAAKKNLLQKKNVTIASLNQREKQIKEKQIYKTCPPQKPYSTQVSCVSCNDTHPLFDLSAKKCTRCKAPQIYDEKINKCRVKYFIGNSAAKNLLSNGNDTADSLKQKQKKIKENQIYQQCPTQKPYPTKNGCIACTQPKQIFNLTSQSCTSCQLGTGQVYDKQTHKCRIQYYITNPTAQLLLQSGDSTVESVKARQNQIKEKQLYKICLLVTPYSIITGCVACSPPNNLFNLSSKSCTSCNQTNNQAFDKKTHTCRTLYYVNNQKATNLLQSGTDTVQKAKLRENEIRQKQFYQQCNQTAPYSTQKGCVACNAPNNVFNLSSKSCTSCQEGQQLAYDSKTSSCRTIFYINNENAKNLLQSDGFTIQKLKQRQNEIKEKEIYKVCDQNAPYSTQKQCVACTPPNNIFSLKTKSCTSCNGTKQDYDNKTNSCKPIYFITNMEAAKKNLLQKKNVTIASLNQREKQIKEKQIYKTCPPQKPYSTQVSCVSCNDTHPLFDLSAKKCTRCKAPQIYDEKINKCRVKYFIGNSAAKNLLSNGNDTADSLKQKQKKIKENQIYQQCPTQKPYPTKNGCIACTQPKQIFNLTSQSCTSCQLGTGQVYDKQTHKCRIQYYITNPTAQLLLQSGDSTVESVKARQNQIKEKQLYKICLLVTPYSIITGCVACSPPNNLFNLSSKSCTSCNQTNNQAFDKKTHTCRTLYYVNNQKATNLLQSGTDTVQKAKLRENEIRQKQFYQQCNQTAPYSTQKGCVACNAPNNVFNLSSKSCTSCQEGQQLAYDSKTSSCRTIFYINNENAKNLLQSDGFTIQKLKQRQNEIKEKEIYKVCDQNAPYSTQKQCVACTPPNNIFSLKTKSCTSCNGTKQDYDNKTNSCKPIYFITNMEAAKKNLLQKKNVTIASLNQREKQIKEKQIYKTCPPQKPYSTQVSCVSCNDTHPLFDLSAKKCTRCKAPQIYDEKINKCRVKYFIGNSAAKNLLSNGNDTADSLKQKQKKIKENQIYQQCPTQKPYPTKNGCIACTQPKQIFNLTSQSCTSCQLGTGQVYDKQTHKCRIQYYITNPTAQLLLQSGDSTVESVKARQNQIKEKQLYKICLLVTPYSIITGCVACSPPNNLFNLSSKSCTSCNQTNNQAFDKKTHTCRTLYYVNNQKATNLLQSGTDTVQKAKLRENEIRQKQFYQQCNQTAPYSTQKGCVACNAPNNVFNLSSKSCTSCDVSKHQIFSVQKGTCQVLYYINNKNAKYLLSSGDSTIEKLNQRQKQIKQKYVYEICKDQTPYSTQLSCLDCNQSNKVFNLSSKSCVSCDSQKNQIFDQSSHSCRVQFYLSNDKINNLLEDQNYTLDRFKQKQNKIKNSQVYKVCPQQTPYPSSVGCIKCTQPNILFNIKTKQCTSCPNNQIYDQKIYKCRKLYYINNPIASKYLENENNTYSKLKIRQQQIKQKQKYKICNQSKPYSTEINCIACQKPNQLFDLSTKKCTNCQVDKRQVYDEKNYKCRTLYYITNPIAKSFIVSGNNTLASLVQRQKNIKQKQYYQVCPQSKPYSDQIKCIACPQNASHYNLSSKSCESCPDDTFYIPELLSCRKIILLTDLTNKNLIQTDKITVQSQTIKQTQIKNKSLISLCPKDKPFSNDKQCINCIEPKVYFNLETLECQNCPQDTIYFAKLRRCKKQILITNIKNAKEYLQTSNKTLTTIQQENNKLKETNPIKQCPQDKPFVANSSCIKCTQDKPHFNLQIMQCQSCQKNQIYLQNTHECSDKTPLTNTSALSNYIEQENSTLEALNKQNSQKDPSKSFICPPQNPISDGKQCTNPCKESKTQPYYNLKINKCQGCVNDTKYSQKSRKCVAVTPRYPNLGNNNWIINNGDTSKIVNMRNKLKETSGSVQCQLSQPFYNSSSKQCLSCPKDQYFNYDSNACQKCDPKSFDINVHQCLKKQQVGTYQTSLASPNLIYGNYPISQYRDAYNEQKSKYPNIKDCPSQKPYYDGITCIQCPSLQKYFNLRYKLCSVCESGSKYVENIRECQTQSGQTVSTKPNPAKMYANIF